EEKGGGECGVTWLTRIWRMASTMFWPCETRTSTCRSFATISSGLYRFLAIAVILDVKDIPQVGPLQWGWITHSQMLLIHHEGRAICGTYPAEEAEKKVADVLAFAGKHKHPLQCVLERAD